MRLFLIDTDYFKRQFYSNIKRDPANKFGWHVHDEITEDYCKQVTSEECILMDTGKRKWIQTRRDNHYLDCEILADAAAYSAGVHNLKEIEIKKMEAPPKKLESTQGFVPKSPGGWIKRKS